MVVKERFKQFLIAFDQWVGTTVGLFLHDGAWADETLSARAHRERLNSQAWKYTRNLIDAIFSYWEPNHCELSYQSEQDRRQLPIEYRK